MGKVNARNLSEYEERLQRAVTATKRLKNPIPVGEAAEEFQVSKRTLYRRVAGTHRSRIESHENQQRLSKAEEAAIVRWCQRQDDNGFPPRLDMVKEMAIFLERKRTGVEPLPVGQNWITRFLTRNPALATKLSTRLERQRSYAKNPALLQAYFTKLGRLIRTHNLQACQIFNMDEKGFLMGLATRAKVLCRRGRRNPHVTHDGKRELVTVIETVFARGAALSPFVINKGKGHYLGWYRNLTDKERSYRFSYSPKGWTDNLLALEWLKDLFDPQSSIVAGIGMPRLLIFDGHWSHITFPPFSFASTMISTSYASLYILRIYYSP